MHVCPHLGCDDGGWPGLHTLRAPGHPSGSPWCQWHGTACAGSLPAHQGPIFPGTQAAVELIGRVLACVAEGRGMRARARVFEVAPNPVFQGLVDAAEQRRALARSFLCDGHVEPVQRDAWYAGLRAVRDGDLSDAEARARLGRSPSWGWTAMAPASQGLLVIDIGIRTLAQLALCQV